MTGIFIYAVESSICLTILWAFHEIALKRDTHHRRNRYYLLLSMIFSAVVPLINLRIAGTGTILPPGGLASVLLPEVNVSPSGTALYKGTFVAALSWFYLAGVSVAGTSLIAGSTVLLKLIFEGKHNGRVIVVDPGGCDCFSAFAHVFISGSIKDNEAARMVSHEMKHIRLGHHTDLMLAGLITTVQWFNPAAYLMKRSLQAVHEYEADYECITEGEDPRSYQELLVTSVFRTRIPVLSNTFSTGSLLKKRIIMMTKKKTGNTASLKMIIALPLAIALIFMFACKDNSVKKEAASVKPATETPEEIFTVVEVMPVFQNDTTYAALMKWVGDNITYPDEAKKNGTQGRVMVRFIIDELGNVSNPEVVSGVDPVLDKAALDVVAKFPQWSPGMQGGKAVKTYFTIPIAFRLN